MATKAGDGSGPSARQVRVQARAEERAGRIGQAIAVLREASERGPDDWTNVRMLADLLTRTGERQAANEHYRRLALNYELDGLLPQAMAVWKRILSNEPESASAHLKLGELYALTGLRADSRRHYEAALERYRKDPHAREVAQIEARLAHLAVPTPGAVAPAVPPLSPEQAAGREERPEVSDAEFVKETLLEARLFRRYGLELQARARLDALLSRFPDHAEARRELADLLHEVGPTEGRAHEAEPGPTAPPPPEAAPATPQREAADDDVDRIDRDDYGTRFELGVACREMGLLDEAVAELKLAAADPARIVECASLLAECFVEQGKPEHAVRWLEKGLAAPGLQGPQSQDLQYALAAACEACGETSRALAAYARLQAEHAGFRDVEERVRRLSKAADRGGGPGV
ncbi:MAG TPA: tetratricopeptide repeat protein [Vicinamibacteria bacterium]